MPKRLTIILLVAQVVLAGIFLARSDKRLSDFPAFFAAARLWQKDQNPFDLASQCREQEIFRRNECLPYVHPPILLPILSLLTTENFIASYWRWVAFSVAILLLCLVPLIRLTNNLTTSVQAILWQPIVAGVWIGQDNAVLLAAILFFVWLIMDERDFLAGVALSFATIKPHFAIALAIPLLVSRRRAFAGFLFGSTVLVLYSLALVGPSGFRGIIQATTVMAESEGFGVWRQGMSNLAGILARAWIDSPLVVWGVFVVSIAGISIYWHREGVTLTTISIALVISMFCAPHVHPWDISSLVIPLAISGIMPLMISSALLFALMPYRLLHWGCYAIMVWVIVRSRHHHAN